MPFLYQTCIVRHCTPPPPPPSRTRFWPFLILPGSFCSSSSSSGVSPKLLYNHFLFLSFRMCPIQLHLLLLTSQQILILARSLITTFDALCCHLAHNILLRHCYLKLFNFFSSPFGYFPGYNSTGLMSNLKRCILVSITLPQCSLLEFNGILPWPSVACF